jgi:hypothetical protein
VATGAAGNRSLPLPVLLKSIGLTRLAENQEQQVRARAKF